MDSDVKDVSKSIKRTDQLHRHSLKTHSGEKQSPTHVSRKDVFENLKRKNTINIDQLSPDTIKFLSPHSVDRLLAKKSVQLLTKEAMISLQASRARKKEPSRSPSPIQAIKRRKRILNLDSFDHIDSLSGKLATSNIASCVSASLDLPLLEHNLFIQSSCEVERKRILNLDSSVELSDGTPLYDENVMPLDLSVSSQKDMFQESLPLHTPIHDISLSGSRLPPMSSTQTSHSLRKDLSVSHISPLVRSTVDSTGDESQCNIFGSAM